MSAFWPSGLISENNPRVAKREAAKAKGKSAAAAAATDKDSRIETATMCCACLSVCECVNGLSRHLLIHTFWQWSSAQGKARIEV